MNLNWKSSISLRLFVNKCYFSSNKPNFDLYYLSGFTDGEGSFIVSIAKNPSSKCGYIVKPVFQISLHEKDKDLLYAIRDSLGGIGQVYNRGKNAYIYMVFNYKELNKIIDHFNTYPLLTCKHADFELFKKLVEMINRKEHLTPEGIKKIWAIKASINNGLPDNLKEHFPDIIPVSRPHMQSTDNHFIPNWLAGFTEGEGSFNVIITKSNTKTGYAVRLAFVLCQNLRDEILMKNLVQFFNCGHINCHFISSSIQFRVDKFSDICDKIIPFFTKYPLRGGKALDFANFCIVAELMKNKAHLTEKGLQKIIKIKANMNKARLLATKTEMSTTRNH
jgi:hypothetical protein